MAQITKTKDGWTTRVYLGREQTGVDKDGKPTFKIISKQIKAPTKAELKRKEAELLATYKDPKGTKSMRNAISEYINRKRAETKAKNKPISPATIVNYNRYMKLLEDNTPDFLRLNIYDITPADRERFVEDLLHADYARNTVKSVSSFISSVLKANGVQSECVIGEDDNIRYIPEIATVKKLLEDCRGDELEPAIILAALGPMRRGEIVALTWNDIDFENSVVHVTKAQVQNENGEYIIKSPKTKASNRIIEYPNWALDRIRAHDQIVPFNVDTLTRKFTTFLDKHGYQHFRFHDLRHFAASYYKEMKVPEQAILRRGGWKTDTVLKKVYLHELNRGIHDEQVMGALDGLRA